MSRAGCSKEFVSDEEVLSTVEPLSKGTPFRCAAPLQSNEPTKKLPSVKWKFRHASPYICTRLSDEDVLSSMACATPLKSNEPTKKSPSVKWKSRHASPYICTRLSDEDVLSSMAPISKGWYRSRLFVEPTEQKRKQKKPSGRSSLQTADIRAGKIFVNV
ncbi:hypothetical protein R1flu_009120 [Riccia fluitans]|uniref:Uncharacterized protein n=1 Tax=Riccia fluitans TaxID=41844 RepID=A0ABD1Z159_9MARC